MSLAMLQTLEIMTKMMATSQPFPRRKELLAQRTRTPIHMHTHEHTHTPTRTHAHTPRHTHSHTITHRAPHDPACGPLCG
jgi:hypothetical protein